MAVTEAEMGEGFQYRLEEDADSSELTLSQLSPLLKHAELTGISAVLEGVRVEPGWPVHGH